MCFASLLARAGPTTGPEILFRNITMKSFFWSETCLEHFLPFTNWNSEEFNVLEAHIKDKAKSVWKLVNGIFWSAGSLYCGAKWHSVQMEYFKICPLEVWETIVHVSSEAIIVCTCWVRDKRAAKGTTPASGFSLCPGDLMGCSSRRLTAVSPLWPGCKWEPTCSPWLSKMRGTCKARALWMSLSKKVPPYLGLVQQPQD